MDDMQRMAAITALNDMMDKGYMSICVIDAIAKMINVRPDSLPAYRMLHTLHCVHFNKMPPELVKRIPSLIMECLGVEPVYQFSLNRQEPVVQTVEPSKKERRGIAGMLTNCLRPTSGS